MNYFIYTSHNNNNNNNYNNNNNNNNNNIDSYIAHFYPQCVLHYESLLIRSLHFPAYVTLCIKYCKTLKILKC